MRAFERTPISRRNRGNWKFSDVIAGVLVFITSASVLLAAQAPAIPIHRVLMDIELGSSLNKVQKTYPPTHKWAEKREPKGGVARILLQRQDCRVFPVGVDRVILSMREGRVIRIKTVYDSIRTRKEPLASLVARLSTEYGAPQHIESAYGWRDSNTQLTAFDEALPLPKSAGVELRTAIEIVDQTAH